MIADSPLARPGSLLAGRGIHGLLALLLGAWLHADAGAARAAALHVDPAGDDRAAGSAAAPFATLARARDAIRAARRAGDRGPMEVIVAAGTYELAAPFELLPEDGGTADAPVRYRAAPGSRPVISGGRPISGWQPAADGRWTVRLPPPAAGEHPCEQLVVNGRTAVRARTPDGSFFFLQEVREEPLEPGSPRPARARQTVRLRRDDFARTFGRMTAAEIADAQLVIYHKWNASRRLPEAIDPEAATIATVGAGMAPWNPWRADSHCFVENFSAAADAAGEWFLSRDHELTYVPRPGEDPAATVAIAPRLERLLVVRGDPASGRLVEHVAIEGLAFRHAALRTPPGGFEPSQAAAPVEAALMIDGARHVTIADCEITHAGGYGVWFRRAATDCGLRRSLVEHMGAGGVRIGETAIRPDERDRTARITVADCIVRHGGRILPTAVGIWIGQSGDNVVEHNDVSDFFYTGISVGWRWGYEESLAKRNTIAGNRVHHLGQGVLSDMGGVYTLGPSEGTVVRGNVFHDIEAHSYGGWGLYTDEGSTGVLFEDNLVHHTKTGGFHQHFGRDNVVRNNILAFARLHQLQATRVEGHRSFTLENNIVIFDAGELLAGPWDRVRHDSRGNLYWDLRGRPVRFLGRSLEEWQAQGHEAGSLVADPLFVDAAAGDFRLRPDSPAAALGFRPFDPGRAGVRGDARWVALARDVTYPPVTPVPPPPPPEPAGR